MFSRMIFVCMTCRGSSALEPRHVMRSRTNSLPETTTHLHECSIPSRQTAFRLGRWCWPCRERPTSSLVTRTRTTPGGIPAVNYGAMVARGGAKRLVDAGLGFQGKVLQHVSVVHSSLGGGKVNPTLIRKQVFFFEIRVSRGKWLK